MAGQLKSGAALSYATVGFSALAGLLYTPWMISVIGSDSYALYTLALSVINFFLMDFGLSDSVARFLSKYYAEGRDDLVGAFLGVAYKAYMVLDAVIFVILLTVFLNADSIYSNLGAENLKTFKLLFCIAAAYSLVSFPFTTFAGTLRSNEKFVALYASNLAEKVMNVGLIVLALALNFGVLSLVVVNSFTSLTFVIVRFVMVRRLTKARADFRSSDRALLKEVLGFSAWVTVAQVCQRFIFAIMPSIVAIVSTTWQVTVFGLAASLEAYVYSVATALNGMFMPRVSRALASGDREVLQAMVSKYGRIQLYIIGLLLVGLFSIGDVFADCWMGEEYALIYPCVLLLVFPEIIELPQLVAHTAAIAANEVKAKAIVYVAMAFINIVLGFVLASKFGAIGACASICVAYLVRTGGLNVIYAKRLKIDLKRFFAETYANWLIPAAVSALFGKALSWYLGASGWLLFFLMTLAIALLYSLCIWLFSFNNYEKDLIKRLFRKLLAR